MSTKSPFINWDRTSAIARKEFYHIFRDPFTLGMALALPVFLVTVFGIAIEFNVKNIPLAVQDSDKTQASRELIETFGSSDYFQILPATSPAEATRWLNSDRARAALIIPPQFEKDLIASQSVETQVIVDGADNSTIGPVLGYLGSIQMRASSRLTGINTPPKVALQTRFLYNPELNSQWFVVPGLTSVVMGILAILLTSMTVAREWENGSMELLLSTPVTPIEIVLGKLTPYAILGFSAVSFVYVIARVGFQVPFMGNLLVFTLGTLLFLSATLAQGLLISVTTRKQQMAMQIAMMSGLLPSLLLSGFIFPIENMPMFFQVLTGILPARWYMEISRGTFLKGATLSELRSPFIFLIFINLVLITVSSKKFKKDLEP